MTTLRVGMPSSITERSSSASVGQACTQAPQDTHSDSKKLSPALADTSESKPRPAIVSANVPWTSEQARTHREQAMHLVWSKSKYGLLRSGSASWWLTPAKPYRTCSRPTDSAMSCSSQSGCAP